MGNEISYLPKLTTSSELSKTEIEMIIANTQTTDESEITSWHEKFYKMAPDGKMTFDTFDQFYRCCNPGYNTKAIAKLLFRHLDKNGNGYINFYDFFITNNLYRNGDARQRAKLIFGFCDTDKNGSISLKELSELLEALAQLNNHSNSFIPRTDMKIKAKEIIKRTDLNKDKKLQRSEFVYSMLVDHEISKLMSFDFAFDVPKN